jgi:hypothetical protein
MAIPITHVLSHWGQAFQFCSFSSNEFYSLVETIVKSHEFPDIKVERVNNKEGGLLSSSREYLRIKHKELVFEICAMQFGKDFCITSWLYETEGALKQFLKFTKAGDYLSERSAKRTFYQADQEAMFKFCAHNAVMEAVDQMTKEKGIRGLSDIQRQMN